MRRLAALAFAGLVLAPAAHAATKGPVFGLRAVGNNQRGYFVYSLSAGASQTGAIIVSNVGNASGTVKLFTSDATTGRTTGTVYETDKQPTRAGSWVTLSSTAVTLAPGGHKQVAFTVHVPAGTPAGQWVGGLVAETSHQLTGSKSKQKANVQIKIRDLTIIAVQVNVPGPLRTGFVIGKVTTGGQRGFQQVIVHIASTGNALVKPTGRVTIFDSKSRLVQTVPFKMDTFLPLTAIDYPLLLKKALPAGDYTASVTLRVPGGSIVRANPAFSVSSADVKQVFTSASPTQAPPVTASSGSSSTSWVLIGAAVAGLLLIVLLVLWLLRRRRQAKRPHPSPSVLAAAAAEQLSAPESPVLHQPVVPAALLTPVAPDPPPPAPVSHARPAACKPYHFWEVAYERGQLGGDGVWRFPHRCENCGLELLARDVSDASAQADRIAPPQ
jgi:MYXO-CTERM domain-containing protein